MTLPHDSLVSALRATLEPSYDIESELTGGGMSRVFVATERHVERCRMHDDFSAIGNRLAGQSFDLGFERETSRVALVGLYRN
jgi:hypothetical protein